jgi:hypothetical protein
MSKLLNQMKNLNLLKSALVATLVIFSSCADAACTTNTIFLNATLNSIGVGSCENSVNGIISINDPGNPNYGIYSEDDANVNNNSGSIILNDNDNYGIYSIGSNTINNNRGSISTNGSDGIGIKSEGQYSNNTNTGTVNTFGLNGIGIKSEGTNSTNINGGSINTGGDTSYGLNSTGQSSFNINSGGITTSGSHSFAISSLGAYTTTTNSGSILTSGLASSGIYSTGANADIINSGDISTSGQAAIGIRSFGANTIINNSGSISTTGSTSLGLYSTGINSIISNSGSVFTTGNSSSSGIRSDGANSTISNSGSVITSGSQGHGVILYGNNQTFTNSGLIKATGANSNSIRWQTGASNGVVNLNRGSIIIGDMVAGDHSGARLNINLGSSTSYAYSVSSHVTVTDLDNRPMVNGSAYAAGIGAQETAAEMLYQRTSLVNSALDRRLRTYASDQVESQPYWLDVYYSDITRNSGGNYSTRTAFSNYNYGMTAGFKLPVQFTALELLVNVEQKNLNIDSGNQKIDSTSIMAGLLAPSITEVFGAKLSAKVLVGYADHDGDRKVMTNSLLYDGSRQIKSDYNSIYAVVGTALTKLYPITDRLTADVILGLDLNTQRFESYKETDYFAWDSRTLTQLQSRVQTGLDYKLWADKGSIFARVGAEHRDLIGGATQDYAINGTNVSFNTNNKNDTYLTAQVGVRAQLEKRIQLFGVVNTLHSSDSVNSVSGNIGLRADF